MVSPLVALAIEPIDFGAQQGRLEQTLGARQNRLLQPLLFQEDVRQFDRSAGQRDRSLDLTRRGQDINIDQFNRGLDFDREKFRESVRQFGISAGQRGRALDLQQAQLLRGLSADEREAAAERSTVLGNAAATLATFDDPQARFVAWQRLAPQLAEAGFGDVVSRVQGPEALTDDVLRTVIGQSSEALDLLEGSGLGPVDAGELSQREREIRDLMQQRGLDQATATGIVDGVIDLRTNPVTGDTQIVDIASGTARPLAVERPGAASGADPTAADVFSDLETVPPDQTLYALADEATGVGPALGRAAQRTIGQVGGLEGVGSEATQAGQAFNIEKNQLIRALSINPRFPVGEIERINREISISPSAFDSPAAMRDRMVVIDRALRRRVEDQLEAAQDPTLNVDDRAAAQSNARAIMEFLNVLGVPQGATGTPVPASAPTGGVEGRRANRGQSPVGTTPPPPDDPPPDGIPEAEWRFMTPEERALWR